MSDTLPSHNATVVGTPCSLHIPLSAWDALKTKPKPKKTYTPKPLCLLEQKTNAHVAMSAGRMNLHSHSCYLTCLTPSFRISCEDIPLAKSSFNVQSGYKGVLGMF